MSIETGLPNQVAQQQESHWPISFPKLFDSTTGSIITVTILPLPAQDGRVTVWGNSFRGDSLLVRIIVPRNLGDKANSSQSFHGLSFPLDNRESNWSLGNQANRQISLQYR